MKKLIAVLLLLAVSLSFCACGTPSTQTPTTEPAPSISEEEVRLQLKGTWKGSTSGKYTMEMVYAFDDELFLCETFVLGSSLGIKLGTYTIGDGVIELKYNDTEDTSELDFTYEDGQLTIYFDENTTLTKSIEE